MINQKDRFTIRVTIPVIKHDNSTNAVPKKDPLRFYYITGLFFGQQTPAENNFKFLFRVFRSLFLTLSCKFFNLMIMLQDVKKNVVFLN